jgi:hypothetical protein
LADDDISVLDRITQTRGGFGHREHLELAWTYLGRYGLEEATQAMTRAVRHVARRHGQPNRYHDTITRAWVRLVAVHLRDGDRGSFDGFIADNPGLLDRHLLARHYSAQLIASDGARAAWAEPDLRPLPAAR